MRKEVVIIGSVFLLLAIGMHHKQWLSHPFDHLMNIPNAGAYGIGFIHPFVFTIAVYLFLWIPRGIVSVFKRNKKGLK